MAALDLQVTKHQTIALCMIVKDEEEIILRALNSVKNIVDYYCICDTGSSDNTVEVIRNYLRENNLSGVVHQRPWKNFAHNRTEAFEYAKDKCDYFMTLDADEVFAIYDGSRPDYGKRVYALPKLKGDRVHVQTYTSGMTYQRAQFFRCGAGPWRWVSPVHEVAVSPNEKVFQLLEGVCVIPNTDGARAKEEDRFLWDAFAFERAVKETPEDSRLWFYMGQSYQDCGRNKQALEAYQVCTEKTVWDEEKSCAFLRMARIHNKDSGFDVALPYYWKSYEAHPNSGSALFDMLRHFRTTGQYHSAIVVGELLLKCRPEQDILFVETAIHKWRAKDELSIAYHYAGRNKEALELVESIIDKPDTPKSENERLNANKKYMINGL